MNHRKVIPIVVLLLASLPVAGALASPGPLLSGYGGPGQGSQAILGATLLSGPSNGGGGGSAGGGQAAQAIAGAAPSGAVATGNGGNGGEAPASAGHTRSPRRTKSAARHGARTEAAQRTAEPYFPAGSHFRAGSNAASAGASVILGLSGSHLLFLVLALAALLFAGVLTRALVHGHGTR
jgi:hypothetical protein